MLHIRMISFSTKPPSSHQRLKNLRPNPLHQNLLQNPSKDLPPLTFNNLKLSKKLRKTLRNSFQPCHIHPFKETCLTFSRSTSRLSKTFNLSLNQNLKLEVQSWQHFAIEVLVGSSWLPIFSETKSVTSITNRFLFSTMRRKIKKFWRNTINQENL